jgi:hypothetical protein
VIFRDRLIEVPDPQVVPKTDVFFHIESFYNRRWRHSALDYPSPEAYERLCYQQEEIFA